MPNSNLTGGPAFPQVDLKDAYGMFVPDRQSGMTLRQYAAIHLKVPDSGTDWLDDMIRQANKIDSEMLTHTNQSSTL